MSRLVSVVSVVRRRQPTPAPVETRVGSAGVTEAGLSTGQSLLLAAGLVAVTGVLIVTAGKTARGGAA